jgi:hypothetical protein
MVKEVFFQLGACFVFSTRSKAPYISKESSGVRFFDEFHELETVKDEAIAECTDGCVVSSCGETLFRSRNAMLRCRMEGIDFGLINKPTLQTAGVSIGFFTLIGNLKKYDPTPLAC